jgi:hypothetical protein
MTYIIAIFESFSELLNALCIAFLGGCLALDVGLDGPDLGRGTVVTFMGCEV